MAIGLKGSIVAGVIVVIAVLWFAAMSTPGQEESAAVTRTEDGKPNLNGIWQSFTTANWDILAHEAQPGPHPAIMGAWGAQPGGLGIVEGNEIPYQPEALEKKKENFKNRMAVKVANDPQPVRHRRPGAAVLPAGRAARQLHAVSLSDFPERANRS